MAKKKLSQEELQKKAEQVYSGSFSMSPYNKNKHVGIEFEFLGPLDLTDLTIAKALVEAGIDNHIDLKSDGSVHGRDKRGHELCLIAPQHLIANKVIVICEVLRRLKCTVNRTCGLHVHLDMRNRDVKKSFSNLVNKLPELTQMVNKGRITNTYCRGNSYREYDQSRQYEGRYRAINTHSYDKHKTLEVRLHQGSLDKNKINKWVKTLVDTVEEKKAG